MCKFVSVRECVCRCARVHVRARVCASMCVRISGCRERKKIPHTNRDILVHKLQQEAMGVVERFGQLVLCAGHGVGVTAEKYFRDGVHRVSKEQFLHVDGRRKFPHVG